jgi:hypothetical protein
MQSPSLEQQQALQQFAAANGRYWKSKLKAAWYNGTDASLPNGGLLRQVRNELGPLWLASFRPSLQTASC